MILTLRINVIMILTLRINVDMILIHIRNKILTVLLRNKILIVILRNKILTVLLRKHPNASEDQLALAVHRVHPAWMDVRVLVVHLALVDLLVALVEMEKTVLVVHLALVDLLVALVEMEKTVLVVLAEKTVLVVLAEKMVYVDQGVLPVRRVQGGVPDFRESKDHVAPVGRKDLKDVLEKKVNGDFKDHRGNPVHKVAMVHLVPKVTMGVLDHVVQKVHPVSKDVPELAGLPVRQVSLEENLAHVVLGDLEVIWQQSPGYRRMLNWPRVSGR